MIMGKEHQLMNYAFILSGTGGWNQNEIDIVYTGVEITTDCSTDFAYSGENFDDNISGPIFNQLLKKYYGYVKYR